MKFLINTNLKLKKQGRFVFYRRKTDDLEGGADESSHSFYGLLKKQTKNYSDIEQVGLSTTRGDINNPAINHLRMATSSAALRAIQKDRKNRDERLDGAFNIAPLAGKEWLNLFLTRKGGLRGFSRFSRIVWDSVKRPVDLMKAVIPDMVDILKKSPYEQSHMDGALLDVCQKDTTEVIMNDGILKPGKKVSYTMLESLEEMGSVFFQTAASDMDESFEAQEGVYQGMELRSKIPRMLHHKVKGSIFSYYKTQLHNAEHTFTANILAAKKELSKGIEDAKTAANQYLSKAKVHNDTGAEQKFIDMTTEILTNPSEFLKNPKDTYGGLNWKAVFPTMEGNHVNFFEMLKSHYAYMIIATGKRGPMAGINRRIKGIEEVVDQRHKNVLRFVKAERIGQDVLSVKNFLEGFDKAEQAVSLDQLVLNIQGSLAQVNLDVDIEQAVFGEKASIKLSAEETFLYQMKYLSKNRDVLMCIEDETKKQIARYLFDVDSRTGEVLAGGSIEEGSSIEIERMVVSRAQIMVDSADKLLTILGDPMLESQLKQKEVGDYTQIIRKFTNFITNFNDLEAFLNLQDSAGTLLKDKLPAQLQQVIANRSAFSNLVVEAEKAKGMIEKERKRFHDNFFVKMMSGEREESVRKLWKKANESLIASMSDSTGGGGRMKKDSGGLVFNAQDEVKQKSLQQQIDNYDKQLEAHDEAEVQVATESFALPPSLSGYRVTQESMKKGLGGYSVTDSIDNSIYTYSMSFEERFERDISRSATMRMEDEFTPEILNMSQQLFQTMQNLPSGYVFKDGISYSNITNQYGQFHLIPGLKNKTSIQGPVRIVRKDVGGSFLLETADQVIKITSPESMNNENLGNVFIWDKTDEQRGELMMGKTIDFNLADSKPKAAGVLVSTQAAVPKPLKVLKNKNAGSKHRAIKKKRVRRRSN